LSYLLSSLFERGVARDKVIVVPPPPNDPEAWKKALELKRNETLTAPPKNNEVNRLYYDAARAYAAEIGCETVETWDALNHPDMFSDGLHFSAKGSDALFQLLWPAIEKRTSALEKRFPDWKDLVAN
jgi:lysophospholipase L1-like esterase